MIIIRNDLLNKSQYFKLKFTLGDLTHFKLTVTYHCEQKYSVCGKVFTFPKSNKEPWKDPVNPIKLSACLNIWDGPRARAMLSYETFDWLLWMRPIESLLGVNSVPSHASDKHAWVTCHRYQPPPLFIRSCTPTSAVRAWINTAGSISTYTTGPVISDKHTPLRYSVCSVWTVVGQVAQTEQA